MRTILLWMARNRLLKTYLPRLWFARRAVRKFMPGETVEDALEAAEQFRPLGIGVLLTQLGENLTHPDQAQAVADHYHDVVRKIMARGMDAEISVKPTQLGLDLDPDATLQHLRSLASAAAEANGTLWLDMEGSAYTERTLDLYRRLKADHPNVGICLQSYLRRTPDDIASLTPLRPAIRLVKGAYDEPAAIAYRDKGQVDANYLALAVSFLKEGRGRPIRLGLGTHDVALIEQIAAQVAPAGIDREGFEIEMLYGIRTGEQFRLAKAGYRVQVLIAYGDAWYPWYMRRLAERPANVTFAIRSLLP